MYIYVNLCIWTYVHMSLCTVCIMCPAVCMYMCPMCLYMHMYVDEHTHHRSRERESLKENQVLNLVSEHSGKIYTGA